MAPLIIEVHVNSSPGGDTEALHHRFLFRQVFLNFLPHVKYRTVSTAMIENTHGSSLSATPTNQPNPILLTDTDSDFGEKEIQNILLHLDTGVGIGIDPLGSHVLRVSIRQYSRTKCLLASAHEVDKVAQARDRA